MLTMSEIQLDTNDFDYNTESDLIEQVVMYVGQFASSVGAEVDIEVSSISFRHESITVGIHGHYIEVGLFSRRWFDGE